jgi:DMSO/TMAO reductase YedYZ molybdopterin-dependent catalytic subunit
MDGKPLTADHGAPLRLVVPQMYGYKGVKWVNEIRALNAPIDGFWEQRGYDRDAWVGHSNGRG